MSNPVSFKVACNTYSCREGDWSYNALRFATKEEAEVYGRDLHSRWMSLNKWEVHPSDDAVTNKMAKNAEGFWEMTSVKGVS
jgi:hypothetical protein